MTGPNLLRDKLARGERALGLTIVLGDAQIAEEFAHAGADYVYIDQQHGYSSRDDLLGMLRAFGGSTTTPLVRVSANDAAEIGRALDAGAHGVIVPGIETAEQARAAASACRYPPAGVRSWGPVRAAHWVGADAALANREVLCFVMIESARGLADAEAIIAVDGVDGVYVGPADLALSLGAAPTMYDAADEQLRGRIDGIRDVCERLGKVAVISGSPQGKAEGGFRMITVGSDVSILRTGAARLLGRDARQEAGA